MPTFLIETQDSFKMLFAVEAPDQRTAVEAVLGGDNRIMDFGQKYLGTNVKMVKRCGEDELIAAFDEINAGNPFAEMPRDRKLAFVSKVS
jgi:hypothetical protein